MSKTRNLFLTASILGAMTAALPAVADGFTQGSTPGSFSFYAFTTGADKLNLSAAGSYLGTAGLFSFTSSFTGVPDSSGAFSANNASVTFSFKATGASSFTNIASGVGNLYYSTDDPGLVFSSLGSTYSFLATTVNPTTSTLPFSLGTKTTGQVTDAVLTVAPVPEASTIVSFGVLLLGGGLLACRRQKAAKTAA